MDERIPDHDAARWESGFERGFERGRAAGALSGDPPVASSEKPVSRRVQPQSGDGAEENQDPAQQTDDPEDRKGDGQKGEEKKRSKLPLIILAIVIVLAIIAGVIWWLSVRNLVSTDDAYTEGRAVTIAPKVAGYVIDLRINDNMRVKAGDLLARIEPRDYVAARDQALASVQLAQAQLDSAQLDLDITRIRLPAQLTQAEAQRDNARASQLRAQADYQRQKSVDLRATTQQDIDQANASARAASATLTYNQAQVQISSLIPQNVALAEVTVKQRQAQLAQAKAQLEQADTNLSYTELRAPQDGWVTKRNVELGTYLQASQSICSLVTPEVWVVANFKETQLNDIRPGRKVDVSVDAYPSLKLHGHVDSVQLGSGGRFTAFPAENATGNFIKIVQRVPVKIVIDSGLDPDLQLPLGLSVEPTVTVP